MSYPYAFLCNIEFKHSNQPTVIIAMNEEEAIQIAVSKYKCFENQVTIEGSVSVRNLGESFYYLLLK